MGDNLQGLQEYELEVNKYIKQDILNMQKSVEKIRDEYCSIKKI